jgi:DNA-binding NtrC family response regulator
MPDESPERYRLLLVDDDKEFLEDALTVLAGQFDTAGVTEVDEVLPACEKEDPDAVLLDLDFHGEPDGFKILPVIRKELPTLPVIIWTETNDIEARLRAQELGAFHYVHKAARAGDMLLVLEAAFKHRRTLLHNRGMLAELGREWGNLVFVSDAMTEVVEMARNAAPTDETVLLMGDTGVGKGAVAHEIHASSDRADEQFVTVECAGFTDTLVESQLFGHVKGSFTGAIATADGLCRAAHHGTLFLDEIGDMPANVQAKIRRMVDDKVIMRVGGVKDIPVNTRIIAATNRDLAKDIEEGRFREDLYHRLDTITIRIPPLRERRDDIIPLALHFLARHQREDREPFELSPDAAAFLKTHDWPGNVRQLKNAIDRTCTLRPGPVLEADDFFRGGRSGGGDPGGGAPWAVQKAEALAKLERDAVVRALALGQDKTKAAEILDVSRSFIFDVMKRRDILEDEWKKPR